MGSMRQFRGRGIDRKLEKVSQRGEILEPSIPLRLDLVVMRSRSSTQLGP